MCELCICRNHPNNPKYRDEPISDIDLAEREEKKFRRWLLSEEGRDKVNEYINRVHDDEHYDYTDDEIIYDNDMGDMNDDDDNRDSSEPDDSNQSNDLIDDAIQEEVERELKRSKKHNKRQLPLFVPADDMNGTTRHKQKHISKHKQTRVDQ